MRVEQYIIFMYYKTKTFSQNIYLSETYKVIWFNRRYSIYTVYYHRMDEQVISQNEFPHKK